MKPFTLPLCALLVLAGSAVSRGALLTGDSFDSYTDGRLSTVSSSAWASSSVTAVAGGTGNAFDGTKYVEIPSQANATNYSASRTFTGLPSSGVYYVQFSLQNLFASSQIGASNQPQLRLTDGTNTFATVLFRNTSDNIALNYATTAGGPATTVETISYATSAWHTFTYAIDLTNRTASIFVDGSSVVASFSFSGFATPSTIDFRAALPTAGTAFRLDAIGFYDTNPLSSIPEPAATATLAGLALLGFACRRRRRH